MQRVKDNPMVGEMHVRWSGVDKQSATTKSKTKEGEESKSEGRNDKQTYTDLYQAIFPIYHVGKLCGLLPVRFVENPAGRYQGKLSVVDIIYSICLLLLLLGAEIWGLWRDLRDGWEQSTRLKSRTAVIATCSDVLGVMSLTSVSILSASFRWKYMQVVLEKLVEVDERIGITAPRKTRRFSIVLTVCFLVYLFVTATLDIYTWDLETKSSKKMQDKGPINYVPLYFMYAVIILLEIQFGVSMYNVAQRFCRLNKCLENILKSGRITDHFRKDLGLAGDFRDQGQMIGQDPASFRMLRKTKTLDWYPTVNKHRTYAEGISELTLLHSSLCDTVSLLNSAYGIAILAVTVTCLLHLIITPYFLILEVDGKRGWIFLLVQLMWCVLHISRMLVIVQPTYATISESKKTAVVVSQMLSTGGDVDARKQLEIFSLQILHRPLEFSVCGLFSLDRALVTSIAGAVTTYLVILIQFQKADDTKGDADIIRNASQLLRNASTLHNITGIKLAL